MSNTTNCICNKCQYCHTRKVDTRNKISLLLVVLTVAPFLVAAVTTLIGVTQIKSTGATAHQVMAADGAGKVVFEAVTTSIAVPLQITNVDSAAIVNTASETAFSQSCRITSTDVSSGNITAFRVEARGKYSNAVVASSLRFRIRYGGIGGTVVADTGAITTVSNASSFAWKVNALFDFRSTTQLAGHIDSSVETAVGTSITGLQTSSSTTVVSSTDKDLVLTVTWGGADPSNTITMEQFNVVPVVFNIGPTGATGATGPAGASSTFSGDMDTATNKVLNNGSSTINGGAVVIRDSNGLSLEGNSGTNPVTHTAITNNTENVTGNQSVTGNTSSTTHFADTISGQTANTSITIKAVDARGGVDLSTTRVKIANLVGGADSNGTLAFRSNGFWGSISPGTRLLAGTTLNPTSANFSISLIPANAEITGASTDVTLTGVAGTFNNYSQVAYNDSVTTTARYVVPGAVTRSYAGGAITVRISWFATVTSNAVVWRVQSLSRGPGQVMDAVVNTVTGHTVTSTVAGTTLQLVTADISFTPSVSELTAGNIWLLHIARDATSGSDTMTGDANVVEIDVWEN